MQSGLDLRSVVQSFIFTTYIHIRAEQVGGLLSAQSLARPSLVKQTGTHAKRLCNENSLKDFTTFAR